jgi:hypothetical protein
LLARIFLGSGSGALYRLGRRKEMGGGREEGEEGGRGRKREKVEGGSFLEVGQKENRRDIKQR